MKTRKHLEGSKGEPCEKRGVTFKSSSFPPPEAPGDGGKLKTLTHYVPGTLKLQARHMEGAKVENISPVRSRDPTCRVAFGPVTQSLSLMLPILGEQLVISFARSGFFDLRP
ncbi:hypothetical protein MKZ38_007493 [Zalerion maritima]|uniref:Uncharacterized protein n=1 Tax=Zalerion maritima TaxID=339359 RepID=A0AAD5RUY4_9PEZI|nr:hypothetical protein MKZ38_007493 [Zalerion maritima]